MSIEPNKARAEMISKELDVYDETNSSSRWPIKFRGSTKNLKVISVDPKLLLFNHNNNRLTAQLITHPKVDVVKADPTSSEAQEVIKNLLVATDGFADLKEQLKILGQRTPGLITDQGVLINGNTRAAALRDIDSIVMEVAVLPANTIEDDIINIEMSLQMLKLVHQDYSFTNELLFMRRYLESGHSEDDLAKQLSWKKQGVTRVRRHMRYLDMIDEVRALTPNVPLPYAIFDAKKQHLEDLDHHYERLKAEGEVDSAEELKWARLVAVLLGVPKDAVRAMQEDFLSPDRLMRRLDENQPQKEFLNKYVISDPNPLVGILPDSGEASYDMKMFTQDMLQNSECRSESNGLSDTLPNIYEELTTEIRKETRQIIDENNLETEKAEPAVVLAEVRQRIGSIRARLPSVAHLKGFKNGNFKYELEKLKKDITTLETQYEDLRNIENG